MKIRLKDGRTAAIVHRSADWKQGLDFITNDEDFIQVGTWWYDQGKSLDKHFHNIAERSTDVTTECVYVVAGSMEVSICEYDGALVDRFILYAGDLCTILCGAHSYDILSDGTKILETKNGPFLGLNLDKTRI